MDNDDDHLDISYKPPEMVSAYISLAFGGVAAIGSVLLLAFGIAPGEIAMNPRDSAANHLCYFGPLVALSWVFFCVSKSRNRFVYWNLIFTLVWFLGLGG